MSQILIDVNISAEDAVKKANELAKSIKGIKDEQAGIKKSGNEASAAYAQNAIQLRSLQAEQKSYITLSQSEIGSNNQLRAQLAVLTAQYNALSKAERDNGLAGKALQTQIRGISDELKVNESIVGDNRRNVGNYRDSLKGVRDQLVGVVPGLSEFTTGLDSLSGIVKTNVTGLGFLKTALISTGIGAIVVLLGSLIAYFQSTEEGSEKLERGIAGLKGAFSAFIAPLAKVGEFLVNLFTNPTQALLDFKALLQGNLLDGIKNFGKSVSDATSNAVNVKQLEQDAEDAGRELNRQASKLRADAAVLRAKGDADSLKQASAYYQKADKLSQQAINNEIKAQQALIKNREKQGLARDEDYDKLNELYAKIDQSRQTDAAKAEKINARVEKQNEAAAKKREELANRQIEADKARSDSELAVININSDARTQEINNINIEINEKIAKYKMYGATVESLEKERVARLLVVQKQADDELVKRREQFETEILQATFKTAELEIANIKDEGERKVAQQQLNQQKELSAIDIAIEKTYARYQSGELEQYDLLLEQQKQREQLILNGNGERANLIKEGYDSELKAFNDQQVALAEARVLDAAGGSVAEQLEANQQLLDAKKQQAIDSATQEKQDITLITAQFADEQRKLNEEKDQAALDSFTSFSDAFISLSGKNSLAGKIAAAVQSKANAALALQNNILIIQDNIRAIAAQGKLPFPANLVAIFSTLAALGSGIASARTLVSGFADGVIDFRSDGMGSMVRGKGTSRSDSINARLSNGESVINERSTKMFAPLLSAINQAGGGRSLSPGFAMASGGIAAGSFVTNMNDTATSQSDLINGIITGFKLAPAPIVDVREVTTSQQRIDAVRVNATV